MKFMDAAGARFVTPSWVARKKIHEAKALTNKPGYKEEDNARTKEEDK